MKIKKAQYLLQMDKTELEHVSHALIDQIESRADEMILKQPLLTYLEFCQYQEPLIALTRKVALNVGLIDEFNLRMTEEIQLLFRRGEKRNETINIVNRSKRV